MIEIINLGNHYQVYDDKKKPCIIFKDTLIISVYGFLYCYNLISKHSKTTINYYIDFLEQISEDHFVGYCNCSRELFFFNEKIDVVKKIFLPTSTVQAFFSPSDNILCYVDLRNIFIYDCVLKKLKVIPHGDIKNVEKMTLNTCYAQFFKLSGNLVLLYFIFHPVSSGFTVFDWNLCQIICTSKDKRCFINFLNGRIYHPKNEYAINKNIKNVKYSIHNSWIYTELFSIHHREKIEILREKECYCFCSEIKKWNGRYLINLEEDSDNSGPKMEIIDSFTNKVIYSYFNEKIAGNIYNFGNYLIIICSYYTLVKINFDTFPETNINDNNYVYIYKYKPLRKVQ